MKIPVATFILDASTSPLLAANWLTLANCLPSTVTLIECFNNSTTPISIAQGLSGQEQPLPFTILPGGTNGLSKLTLRHDQRLSLQPSENISQGYVVINLYTENP